jgi:hypothetical protein
MLGIHRTYSSLLPRHGSVNYRLARRRTRRGWQVEQLEWRTLLSTWPVTSVADTEDPGTLRWAIEQANSNNLDDTIDIVVTGAISLKSPLELKDTMGVTKIIGPGASSLFISPGYTERYGFPIYTRDFVVDPGVRASLSGLTISGHGMGAMEQDMPDGGIENNGDLKIVNCEIVHCYSPGPGAGQGGGVGNWGTLEVLDSTIRDNNTGGASHVGSGGGIYSEGTLTIVNSTVADNKATNAIHEYDFGKGGGIYSRGSLTIRDSSVVGCQSSNEGGGIYYAGGKTEGDKFGCVNTTVDNNTGGGIFNAGEMHLTGCSVTNSKPNWNFDGSGIINPGTAFLTNCTVAKNVDGLSRAGGIDTSGSLTMKGCTVSDNSGGAGGIHYEGYGVTSITSSILAGNTGLGVQDVSGSGQLVSGGYNVIGNKGSSSGWDPKTDQTDVDPLLETKGLQDNGGPTQTIALQAESPAIGKGDPSLAGTTDQRGLLRPQGGVDAGACQYTFATISGRVYNDVDNSGTRDDGEPGIPSVQVYLDQNGDGQYETGEPLATTDAGGYYTLAVPSGVYAVRLVQIAGYTLTEPSGGSYTVDTTSGGAFRDNDFGSASVTLSNGLLKASGGSSEDTIILAMNRPDEHHELTFTMAVNGYSRTFPASSVTSISITTQGGGDDVVIEAPPAGIPVTVNGGSDAGGSGGSSGPSVMVGSESGDSLLVDYWDATAASINIDASTVNGPGGTINYSGLGSLEVAIGGRYNTVNVASTNPATTVAVNLGAVGGNTANVLGTSSPATIYSDGSHLDTINVGDSGSVQNVLGPLNILTLGEFHFNKVTTVNIDDSADTDPRTVTIDQISITGLTPAPINYTPLNVRALNIRGGGGGNHFTVESTVFQATTTLNTGSGSDSVNVRKTELYGGLTIDGDGGNDSVNLGGGLVTGLLAPVTIGNSAGHTALMVDDSGDATGRTVAITAGQITVPLQEAPPNFPLTVTINYAASQLSLLKVDTGTAADTINVRGTAVPTDLTPGPGNDTINVGTGALDSIQGELTVNGDGNDTMTVLDNGLSHPSVGPYTYTIKDHSVSRSPATTITYSGLAALNVFGSGDGNSFLVEGTTAGTSTTVVGGKGVDQFTVSLTGDYLKGPVWTVGNGTDKLTVDDSSGMHVLTVGPHAYTITDWTVSRDGVAPITYSGFVSLNVLGSNDGDTFNVQSTRNGTKTSIVGGAGVNTLDYSGYKKSEVVKVNLAAGTATGLSGITNIRNVVGGPYGSILVGDANPNVLTGGPGRNLIIGGGEADTLNAGKDGDLLIGGSTAYDQNTKALDAILAA